MYSTLKNNIDGNIGFIELNQPPGNTMTRVFFKELKQVVHAMLSVKNLNGIIVTGNGRHFSSGADIDDLIDFDYTKPEEASGFYFQNNSTFSMLHNAKIPVVALIKGVCLGSAFELALSCHFRFATESALMSFPEAGFNLMPGCGGSVFLSEILNKREMIELMLGGKTLNSADAANLNVIDKIMPKNEISEKAVNFVNEISKDYQYSMRNFYLLKKI